MPTVRFANTTVECEPGANLRKVLLEAKLPLYNGPMGLLHCRGFGTCGTCAVQITGPVSEPTKVERWRLAKPPHSADGGLRLACQCRVEGDIDVIKYPGAWGQSTDQPPLHSERDSTAKAGDLG